MKTYAFHELLRLTRIELCALEREIAITLVQVPAASEDYRIALENLRRLRWVLAQPSPKPS